MGTYWRIENTLKNRIKFRRIYRKHYKKDKHQFDNDFGYVNSFSDIWCKGFVKVGVMKTKFYTKEFRAEIEKNFNFEVC